MANYGRKEPSIMLGVPALMCPKPEYTQDWRERANCRDKPTDLFFPTVIESKRGGTPSAENQKEIRKAQDVCMDCPVRPNCLWWAVESNLNEFGIYGGATPGQRKAIRRSTNRLSEAS